MTTPNIKALAEKIKKNYEADPAYADWLMADTLYQLSSALLRVLDEQTTISIQLKQLASSRTVSGDPFGAPEDAYKELMDRIALARKMLESHNKLMEELNENIKP